MNLQKLSSKICGSLSDRVLYALVFSGGAGLLVLLYFFDPSCENSIFPPCPTNYISGYYCTGCGTLRALHALVHGEFAEAFSQNALSVVFLPLLPLIAFCPKAFLRPSVAWGIIVLFVVFTILRNCESFSFLAPH